jgi:S1-C subfamily serine protease
VVSVAAGVWIAATTSNGGDGSKLATISTTELSSPTTEFQRPGTTLSTAPLPAVGEVKWEEVIRSVAYIGADCPDGSWSGSGVVVLDGSYVLTNYHVAEGATCSYFVCFTDNFEQEPVCEFDAEFVVGDVEHDLAVLRLVDGAGRFISSGRPAVPIQDETPPLGSELTHIGYPGLAGLTLTLTVGRLSGLTDMCDEEYLDGSYFKTDATGGPGMSGGGVFNSQGEYVGTHTLGCNSDSERGDYSFVRPARLALSLLRQVGT